jgi:hypothetical protein
MSVVTPHQTDLTTSCKFKRDHRLRRALHLLLNLISGTDTLVEQPLVTAKELKLGSSHKIY